MKVKNVSRVENNTENFNTGMEKDLSSKGQSSSKNTALTENVVDIVDINANSEFAGTSETEIPSDKAAAKNDAVFYNGKQNPTGKDENAGKNSAQSNMQNDVDAEGDIFSKNMQGKMLYGKNEYSKTISSASSNLSGMGREYGNPKQLNTLANPQMANSKKAFYNGQRGSAMVNGMADGSVDMGFGVGKSGFSGTLNGRADSMANGADISGASIGNSAINRGTNGNWNFGNVGSFDENGYRTAENMNLGASRGTVDTGVSNNEMNGLLGKADVFRGEYNSSINNAPDSAGSVKLGNAGQQIQSGGSEGRTLVLSNGEKRGNTQNSDANYAALGREKSSVQNTYSQNTDSGSNTTQAGGYILGRDTAVTNTDEAQTVNSRYDDRDISDKTLEVGTDIKNGKSASGRRSSEIRRRNVENQEYISAQMAYQGIIRRSITDIYKVTPELDKLIMLLFRVRKLTVKKIENNGSRAFERRSVEEEAELILDEVKNLIENGGYKKGKVINLIDRFLDDQEKIKSCVGLSPFPIDIKDFEQFYEGVKDEVEDIRDYVEEERRKELWRSMFRIFVLAFFVVILYILFLR